MPAAVKSTSDLMPLHERQRSPGPEQKVGDQLKDNSTKMVMGRYEDWLKLTMACVENQDPMNPMNPTEMATQFAHFGQIIGVLEIKEMMQKVINAQGVTQVLEAASQLDRMVEVASNKFHYQENDVPQLSYTLPKGAHKSMIVIYDDKMQMVKTMQGESIEGKHLFKWDGEDFKGAKVEPGQYSFKVMAYDESSALLIDRQTKKPVPIPTTVRGTITGGEFTHNKPMLNMRGVSVPLETLVGIHSIENGPKANYLKNIPEITEPLLDLDGRVIQSANDLEAQTHEHIENTIL